jgi:filamentous hemagglutinin
LGTGLDVVGSAFGNPNLGDHFRDWAEELSIGSTPAANAGWYDPNDRATQAASMAMVFFTRRPGRLGNSTTRQLNGAIADRLEQHGWTITGGGGRAPETFLPGAGPGTRGGNFIDITATRNDQILHVNTVSTLVDGVTPTANEAAAAAAIRAKLGPNEKLTLIPKKR